VADAFEDDADLLFGGELPTGDALDLADEAPGLFGPSFGLGGPVSGLAGHDLLLS